MVRLASVIDSALLKILRAWRERVTNVAKFVHL